MARVETGVFVTGLLTGALVGAALAMVLAPSSGEETRDLLRAKSREFSNLARDTAGDLADQAESVYERGRQMVAAARSTVDEAVDEGRAAAAVERDRLNEIERE